MKLNAVTEHKKDPNITITIVSIVRGLLPRLSIICQLLQVRLCSDTLRRPRKRSGGGGAAHFLGFKSVCRYSDTRRPNISVSAAHSGRSCLELDAADNAPFAIALITRIIPANDNQAGSTESS